MGDRYSKGSNSPRALQPATVYSSRTPPGCPPMFVTDNATPKKPKDPHRDHDFRTTAAIILSHSPRPGLSSRTKSRNTQQVRHLHSPALLGCRYPQGIYRQRAYCRLSLTTQVSQAGLPRILKLGLRLPRQTYLHTVRVQISWRRDPSRLLNFHQAPAKGL